MFHVNARNVLASGWRALGPREISGNQASDRPIGFRVRLLETDGKSVQVRLRVFRKVAEARKVDFLGQNLGDLPIDDDTILCELAGHEWAEVEAFW
jgi:hypothetical protein